MRPPHGRIGYFHTDYDNRIRGAAEGTTREFLLSIEDRLPEGIIIRGPGGTLQTLNLVNINSASTLMSGWDLDLGYAWSTPRLGRFTLGATATLLSKYEDRIIDGAPILDRKGKVGNPPEWRGRLSLGWRHGIWSASAALNYIDGLFNDSLDPRTMLRDVGSQTTVDVQAGVAFGNSRGPLRLSALEQDVQRHALSATEVDDVVRAYREIQPLCTDGRLDAGAAARQCRGAGTADDGGRPSEDPVPGTDRGLRRG